jgi:hypothetical protein
MSGILQLPMMRQGPTERTYKSTCTPNLSMGLLFSTFSRIKLWQGKACAQNNLHPEMINPESSVQDFGVSSPTTHIFGYYVYV